MSASNAFRRHAGTIAGTIACIVSSVFCYIGGYKLGTINAEMERLPFDVLWNLRLLGENPDLKKNTNGLPQEMLYSCLLYYKRNKETWFRRWRLNAVIKKNPSLIKNLVKARDAVQEFEIVDVDESRKTNAVKTKKGAEFFRDLSIP